MPALSNRHRIASAGRSAGKTEILWDHCGVPHIFAPDGEAMFKGEAWAPIEKKDVEANLEKRETP